jgi:hypothetical protein
MISRAEGAGAGDTGSIFIETLAALTLLTVMVAAVCQIVADSATRRREIDARLYALMVARSALASAGAETPLANGAAEGQDGADVWRMEMRPCGPRSDVGVLYCVSVAVRDAAGGPPLAILSTRKLAPRV